MGSTERDGRPEGGNPILANGEPDHLAAPPSSPPRSRTLAWLLASLAVVGLLGRPVVKPPTETPRGPFGPFRGRTACASCLHARR
jgi:hypothetical protein